MKITALIPARSGSKRIPDKNIQILNGKPLFVHSIITAKQCISIDAIFFSTDSERYLKLAKNWKTHIAMRSKQAASDIATDYDVIKDAMDKADMGDMIVYLRPTTPMRTVGMVEAAIARAKEAYDSITGLRSIEEMRESAYKNFEVDFGYLKPLIGTMTETNWPNQVCPRTYKANGYVDIILPKGGELLKNVYGNACLAFITPRTVEIDTIEDLRYAEWLMKMEGHREEVRFV